jgi:hypothetical protein
MPMTARIAMSETGDQSAARDVATATNSAALKSTRFSQTRNRFRPVSIGLSIRWLRA